MASPTIKSFRAVVSQVAVPPFSPRVRAMRTFTTQVAVPPSSPRMRAVRAFATQVTLPPSSPRMRWLRTFSVLPPDPGTPGTGQVFEVTGYTAGGGDTTPSVAIAPNDFEVTVASPANFAADDWVEILEGPIREYAQIEAVNGSVLRLYSPLVSGNYTTSATVKEVDVVQKYENLDWTINRTTGEVTLLAGRFTAGKEVFARYSQTISDLDGYECYRIPGDLPQVDKDHYNDITGHGSVVTVDAAIASGATSVVDTLDSTLGGSTQSYYLFSKDISGNLGRAQGVMVEAIGSVLQGWSKAVGPEKVTLSWTALSEPNVNGINIYRCENTWNPANAVKVNSTLITSGTSFIDGAENVTNRRPAGEVPYPVPGGTYYYVAEVEDSVTEWDTGTSNEAADPLTSEVLVATKVDD